jgi:hypothetical protein
MRALRRTAARDPKPVPRRLPGAQPFSDTTHPASSPALPSGKSLDLHAGAFPFGLRAPGPMLRQLTPVVSAIPCFCGPDRLSVEGLVQFGPRSDGVPWWPSPLRTACGTPLRSWRGWLGRISHILGAKLISPKCRCPLDHPIAVSASLSTSPPPRRRCRSPRAPVRVRLTIVPHCRVAPLSTRRKGNPRNDRAWHPTGPRSVDQNATAGLAPAVAWSYAAPNQARARAFALPRDEGLESARLVHHAEGRPRASMPPFRTLRGLVEF